VVRGWSWWCGLVQLILRLRLFYACSQVVVGLQPHMLFAFETPMLPLVFKRYWVLRGLRTWILVFFSPLCLQRTSLFPLLQASCHLFLDFWCNWFSIFLGVFLMKLILQFSVSLQIVAIVVTLFDSLPCSLVKKRESYWFFRWFFYTRPCWEACKILQF